MRPRHMKTLLGALVALLTLGGLLAAASSAQAAPAAAPVIVAPAEGQVIDGDFSGPITVDFAGAAPGDWTVGAFIEGCSQPAGTSKCASWAQVQVTSETTTLDVTLPETLGRSGDYIAKVMRADGSGTPVQSGFTIIDATDDTEPDPVVEGGGRIVSPSHGQHVRYGYEGPIVLDLYNTSAPVTYLVDVSGPGRGVQEYVTTRGGRAEIHVPALRAEGEWYVDLYRIEDDYFLDEVRLTVGGPPPVVSILGVSPETFYPTVRDGFRDDVLVRYRVDQRSAISYQVRDSRNRLVATRNAGRHSGRSAFLWNGKRDNGKPVSTGKYTITVSATNNDGQTTRTATKVTAVSDVVTRRGDDFWRGTQTDRRSKRGNCYFRGYAGELTLDCWAGKHARAEYDFRIPASATNLRYTVRGERNCCDRGKITFTGKRVSQTRFTAAVNVTYWRSYTIRRVDLTYRYEARR